MSTASFDPRYLKGIEHFNAREFFDAHEVWEDVWNDHHDEAHQFVQGLIQFATALHHFEASNMKGTVILYKGGMELLQPYAPIYWNLPVQKLMDDMTACVKDLLPFSQAELPGRYDPKKREFSVQIKEELIPKIKLNHA